MMKGQKGITLVALVITIIVMLILAGVTISIAINGGLFGQAQNAVTGTQKAAAKEYAGLAAANAKANLVEKIYVNNSTSTITSVVTAITTELTANGVTFTNTTANIIKVQDKAAGGTDVATITVVADATVPTNAADITVSY